MHSSFETVITWSNNYLYNFLRYEEMKFPDFDKDGLKFFVTMFYNSSDKLNLDRKLSLTAIHFIIINRYLLISQMALFSKNNCCRFSLIENFLNENGYSNNN